MATVLEDVAADLDILYDVDFGFAENVTTSGGTILGVFDESYYLADGVAVGVRSASPVLRTRDADAIGEGIQITVRGNTYVVTEPQPDGFGETIHNLRAV